MKYFKVHNKRIDLKEKFDKEQIKKKMEKRHDETKKNQLILIKWKENETLERKTKNCCSQRKLKEKQLRVS